MNALTKHENNALPALQQMTEAELISVMSTSIYPGAKLESIKMVLGYCKATGLDPMKKPVHIVPMKVSTGEKDQYGNDKKETRDVIMPGVGSYRTDAARTGQYAGMSEPEFGPTLVLEFEADEWYDRDDGNGNARRAKRKVQRKLSYPEWCRITVERIVDGEPRKFTAREYWVENYATRGSDGAPNDMWSKRPIGQLVKCTEAQALRKAFPETISAQPTADEMEGKTLDEGVVIDAATGEITGGKKESEKKVLPPYPADKFEHNLKNVWAKRVSEGSDPANLIIKLKTVNTLTAAQEAAITALKPAAPASDAPVVTASEVLEKLNASATSEDLDAAAGLIPAVPEAERAALNARYDELHAKFNPKE